MILVVASVMLLLSGVWGLGELYVTDRPAVIECGENLQLNWMYVNETAAKVFSIEDTLVFELAVPSMIIKVEVVSPLPLRRFAVLGACALRHALHRVRRRVYLGARARRMPS
jgi:hypothetical protein